MPSATTLSSLPQDLTLKILANLPITSLPNVAVLSRRFKVLVYNESLWEFYLRKMGVDLSKAKCTSPPIAELIPGLSSASLGTSPTTPSTTSRSEGDSPCSPNTNIAFDLLNSKLPSIPSHVTSIWSSAISTISEKLQTTVLMSMPQSRKVAKDTFKTIWAELWPYYKDFRDNVDGKSKVLTKQDPVECSILLCQLTWFAKVNIANDWKKIVLALQSTCEYFESKVISKFDRAYEIQDIDEMKKQALVLYHLNGGTACIQFFIFKNAIFFDLSGDVTENFKILTLDGGENSPLHEYITNISDTIHSSIPTIDQIFPNPDEVILTFVQKVFEECIFEYLNKVLSEAQNRDLTLYLQSLSHIFIHSSILIQSLASRLDSKHVENLLHQVLAPFTQTYMEQELKFVNEFYSREIEKWEKKIAAAKKTDIQQKIKSLTMLNEDVDNFKRKVMNSVKTVLLTPQNLIKQTLKNDKHYQPTVGGWGLDRARMANDLQSTIVIEKLDQLDMLLSVELALQMIHVNKESLKRCVVMMSSKGYAKQHVEVIFSTLLKRLGNQHIKPCFDLAIERLGIFKAGVESNIEVGPLIQFLEMVHVADLIMQMVHLYFTEEIRKFVDIYDFLAPSVAEKKKFEHMIDDLVACGLDQAIRVLMDQVEFIIATEQAPTDYLPEEEELDLRPTMACRKAIDCMSHHARMLVGAAEKQVMEVFFSEIGHRFFAVLCKHLKRMKVSEPGGFQLICDLNAYYAWSVTLKNPEVSKMFNALKEVANIYIVSDRSSLKELLKDHNRYLGVFRVEEVYEFVERRDDYEKIRAKVKESECVLM